ncbi:MAG: hypothetical protein U0U67_06805 [Chitinophagales bacterium]
MKYSYLIITINTIISILLAYFSVNRKWYIKTGCFLFTIIEVLFLSTLFIRYAFPTPMRCGNPILSYLSFNLFTGGIISFFIFMLIPEFKNKKITA